MLAYLRQTDLPRGDPDRAQRQQAVMRGGLYRIMSEGPGGPVGLYTLSTPSPTRSAWTTP